MRRDGGFAVWVALALAGIAGLVLVLIAVGSSAGSGFTAGPPPPEPAEGGTAVHATPHAGGRELVLDFGPFDLPARAGHHDIEQPTPGRVRVPVGGWVRGFRVDLVDAEGRILPQTLLHHVNVIATGHREVFSEIMRRVAAAGHETAPVLLPRVVGYPMPAGDELLMVAMLHNPTDVAYESAFVRVTFRLTPERRFPRPLAFYPFYLDVMPPASVHAFDLPPGRFVQSWEGSPVVSGRILGMGGHLHRYGIELVLEDVARGRVIWRTEPVLDHQGNVAAMPPRTFLLRGGIPLRSDRVYRLTAVYDNPTGRTIPLGGMGALGGAFVPARGERLPPADPRHPEYLLDMELLHQPYDHGPADGAHDHGHGDGHHHHH